MEKNKFSQSQLELFSQKEEPYRVRSEIPAASLGYVVSFEKMILVAIGFIVTAVVAFCLGVEKGKTQETISPTLASGPSPSPLRETVQGNPVPAVSKPEVSVKSDEESSGYTVQVASYQTRSYAEKETAKLKKKGFSTLILSKGKYVIVCVGNFTDKEKARSLQTELRLKYRDCCIRRL
jgi:hypothetical protein